MTLSLKEIFDKVLEEAVANSDVSYFPKKAPEIAAMLGVQVRAVYVRFRSVYGMSPQEKIKELLTPSKEKITRAILENDSAEEFWLELNLPPCIKKSALFDKNFGVSTFSKARLIALNTAWPVRRKQVTREDNTAIMMSQHIGDGHYYRDRHALRISHGVKQSDYLRWKVSLIKEAYPYVSDKIVISKHKQGHTMFDWYSRKLGKIEFPEDKKEAVKKLTPFGWLLLFFDDGSKSQNFCIHTKDNALAACFVKELKTYGINSRVMNNQGISLCGDEEDLKFYKNFIEPYTDIIPKCMLYKTKLKI